MLKEFGEILAFLLLLILMLGAVAGVYGVMYYTNHDHCSIKAVNRVGILFKPLAGIGCNIVEWLLEPID